MPRKRKISADVSQRILKELDKRIMSGETSNNEFCEVAGIALPNLSVIRQGKRYFTLDNIHAIGREWDLDMNLVIYGKHLDRKTTPLGQLKEAVERLESEVPAVNKNVNKIRKKSRIVKK